MKMALCGLCYFGQYPLFSEQSSCRGGAAPRQESPGAVSGTDGAPHGCDGGSPPHRREECPLTPKKRPGPPLQSTPRARRATVGATPRGCPIQSTPRTQVVLEPTSPIRPIQDILDLRPHIISRAAGGGNGAEQVIQPGADLPRRDTGPDGGPCDECLLADRSRRYRTPDSFLR